MDVIVNRYMNLLNSANLSDLSYEMFEHLCRVSDQMIDLTLGSARQQIRMSIIGRLDQLEEFIDDLGSMKFEKPDDDGKIVASAKNEISSLQQLSEQMSGFSELQCYAIREAIEQWSTLAHDNATAACEKAYKSLVSLRSERFPDPYTST